MRKVQLIECGVIIIGVLLLYYALMQLLGLLAILIYSSGVLPTQKLIGRQIWVLMAYVFGCGFLLRYSGAIAAFFGNKVEGFLLEMTRIHPRHLLQIALIILGLVQVFTVIPDIVAYFTRDRLMFYDSDTVGGVVFSGADKTQITVLLTILIFALLITFCSRGISKYFFPDDHNAGH
jgi:hypothetical protein